MEISLALEPDSASPNPSLFSKQVTGEIAFG